VTLADTLSAHKRALQSGGLDGIRDLSQIEAAIARAYSGYHWAIAKKAGVLVQSISGSHGFIDGNKRTAVILVDLLILKSGYCIVSNDLDREMEEMVLDLVCHRMTLEDAIQWFEKRLRRL
jgi:death on curing protein